MSRLRHVVYRLSELETAMEGLADERRVLSGEREQLLASLGPAQVVDEVALDRRPVPGAPPGEWRADVVRDVLLWFGGALLAIAALTFAAFAWRRLDDGGRAAMLVGATALAALAAAALRTRLAATAEVFASLALTMLLIDWLALRRAGVGSELDLPTWWALGTLLVGVAASAAGRVFSSARVLAVVATGTAAYLGVFAAGTTAPAISMGLSLAAAVAVGATVLLRNVRWATAAHVAVVAAVLFSTSATVAVLTGVADTGEPTLALFLAALMVAGAPAAAATVSTDPLARDLLVGAAVVACLGASTIAWWTVASDLWLLPLVAATTLAVLIGGSVVATEARRGTVGAASMVLLGSTMWCAGVVGVGVLAPLGGIGELWTHEGGQSIVRALPVSAPVDEAGPVAAVLVCAAAGALIMGFGARADRTLRVTAGATAGSAIAAAVALVPIAIEARLDVAAATTALPAVIAVAFLGLADRMRRSATIAGLAGFAVTLAPASIGWSFASEAPTVAFCAAVLVAGSVAAALARSGDSVRLATTALATAGFVALAGTASLAADASTTEAGVVLVAAAAAALIAASLWLERDGWTAEAVAVAGAGVGLALSAAHDVDIAIGLTVLAPAMAVAGTRRDRRIYVAIASVVAVCASWAWLFVADVRTLEAYTLPAALGALAAGEVKRRLDHDSSSWLVYAPSILIAFAPTLGLALVDDGLVRVIALAVAAAALTAAGGRWRLQAPLVLGTGTLALLALDTLGPVAAQLPRWLTIAIVGAILLWLGATADRRLTQLRRTRDRLGSMER